MALDQKIWTMFQRATKDSTMFQNYAEEIPRSYAVPMPKGLWIESILKTYLIRFLHPMEKYQETLKENNVTDLALSDDLDLACIFLRKTKQEIMEGALYEAITDHLAATPMEGQE